MSEHGAARRARSARAQPARFTLKVSVSSGGVDEDLIVEAGDDDTVGDLAAALDARDGRAGGRSLWSGRTKRLLDPTASLADAGIRWGDVLLFLGQAEEPTTVGTAATVEMLVTAGPCAGRRWAIADGVHRIGRGPSSEVQIDDPSLSRVHASIDVHGGVVAITDLDSSNGVAIDGKAIVPGEPHTLRLDDELELGRTLLRVRAKAVDGEQHLPEHRGHIEFNRPPRVNPRREPFLRELAAPPDRARKARLPLAASIVPLLMGVAMFVLLKSPFMLVICALTPVMALTTYVTDRRGGKKSFNRSSAEFRSQVAKAIEDLDGALERETIERRQEAPDLATLFEQARRLDPSIWERRPADPDFMALRVGVGDLPARSRAVVADGGDTALRGEAEQELALRETLPAVPFTLGFLQTGVVGLAGPRSVTEGVARGLILQAASLHSPGDLVIAACISEAATTDWDWLKWLPHVAAGHTGLRTSFAQGRAEAQELLHDLRDLVADRRAQARSREHSTPQRTTVLVLVDEDAKVDRSLVSAAFSEAAENGVTAIWLGRDARNLPGQSGAIIEASDSRSLVTVTDVSSGGSFDDLTADGAELDEADRAARTLAPIHDISELARAGDIPARIGLLELLQLSPVTAEQLQHRWGGWRGRLEATIGVGIDGPLTVDLRTDGPHALIAGTTGSGKSELLRTFVAAAAASVPPDRLEFLLIDYKGGAAFAPCKGLPHVVDVVSDLDDHLAERALVSLDAELKRRERILAELGARDLQELQRRVPDRAPPLLVIAVDEFAKLREEVPEFVDGVVDIAQRGRSLGVHMVLAAQTLRNAFTPAIRANTNLRIALRVADDVESEDVLASPLAARIPSGERYRGRAFARTGHSELKELQTAYVSGRTSTAERQGLELRSFSANAGAKDPYPATGLDSDQDNDLTALAAAAVVAQRSLGLRKPPPPWLAPLPDALELKSIVSDAMPPGCAAIGLVDLPQLQRQDPLVLDLPRAGHVAVFGAGGSGKTTVLTSSGLALAQSHSPDELRIYGIDGGSGHLMPLENLPHCGSVVPLHDEERVARLMRQLVDRVEKHPAAGSSGSLSSGVRRTVLLLDDLGSFANQYDKPGTDTPYEQLYKLLTAGRAAGVHVVFTAARRGAVSSAFNAHIGQRLVLRMQTEEELLALGLDARKIRGAKLPPGRGFTQETQEFQIGVPIGDGQRLDFSGAAAAIPSAPAAATRIGRLPTSVARGSLSAAHSPAQVPLGISDADLGTAAVDLTDTHFLVVGGYRSGRSTALATLAQGLRGLPGNPPLWLVAPRKSPLRDLAIWERVATTAEACTHTLNDALELLSSPDESASKPFLFIDDGGEIFDALLNARLERILRAGRDEGLIVVSAVETSAARGIAIPWIRELRKDGHGLLLQPDLLADGDLFGVRLPRRVAAPMVPGRGFMVRRGVVELVQVGV